MTAGTARVTLEVKVRPRSNRNAVEVVSPGHLRVRVTVVPEGGKANAAVLKLLAKKLGVPKSRMTIIRGLTNRDKVISIGGITSSELEVSLRKLSD